MILANIVPRWGIEGRKLASFLQYPNKGISAITLLLYSYMYKYCSLVNASYSVFLFNVMLQSAFSVTVQN